MQELFKEKVVRCHMLNSGRKSSYPLNYSWEANLRSGTPEINYSDYYILNKSARGNKSSYKSFNSLQNSNSYFSYRSSINKKTPTPRRSYRSIKNPFESKNFDRSSIDQEYTPLKISNTLIARKMFELQLANQKFIKHYNQDIKRLSTEKTEAKILQENSARSGVDSKRNPAYSSNPFINKSLKVKDTKLVKHSLANNQSTFSDSQFELTEMETKDEMFTQ